jgi:hypothetical protein
MKWIQIYNIFIILIIIIKVFYIFTDIDYFYQNEIKKGVNIKQTQRVDYWRPRFEFIFMILMGLLLVIVFYPRSSQFKSINIDNETKYLFFILGFIIIFTAHWNLFFKESKWFSIIQKDL